MQRLTLTLAVLAVSLAVPAGASAHKPYLTVAQAEAAIRRADAPNKPSRVILSDCRRESRTAIACQDEEIDAQTDVTIEYEPELNEPPMTDTLSSTDTARLVAGHVRITSSL